MLNKEKKLEAFVRALDVMDRLRADCPWNHAQTIDTLRPMTIEEVYELSDAVLKKDEKALEKELGDVFLHVIFYAKIAVMLRRRFFLFVINLISYLTLLLK